MTRFDARAFRISDPPDVAAGNRSIEKVPIPLPDFNRLYDDYVEFVWRNARRLGIPDAAVDDVVQDVFVVAHRKLSAMADPGALRAWMFGIVIRVVRAHRRRMRRKPLHRNAAGTSLDLNELPDPRRCTPLSSAEEADLLRLLHQLLGELDDAKREVFVLAELEDLTEAEIAAVLGESVNTVHSRLRAARKGFDRALQRQRSRDEWRLK